MEKRCLSLGCHGGEAAVADMDHMCLTWVCVRASGATSREVCVYSHKPPKRKRQDELVLQISHQTIISSKRPSGQGH